MIVGAGKDMTGSRRRVFCRPRKTGSVRSSVPKPRSLSLSSGLPGFSSRPGLPISLFLRRRVRIRGGRCRAAKFPSDRAARAPAGCRGCGFLRALASEKFLSIAACRRGRSFRRSGYFWRGRSRCCRARRPRACRRGSSCWWKRRGFRWRGIRRSRRFPARRAGRRDSQI